MASSTTDTPEMDVAPDPDEPKPSSEEAEVPQSTSEQDGDAQPVSPDSNTNKDPSIEEPKVDTAEIPVHQGNRRAPVRYLQVEGIEGRTNDLVYCAPLQTEIIAENGVESTSGRRRPLYDADRRRKRELKSNENKVVIYFGGDIQDFPEAMELHVDHRLLSNWNLEMTAVILQNQFPEHHIVVVRPSRMQMLTYSCFDNFVPSNNIGVPDHTPNHGALQHLEALLSRLSSLIQMSGQNREEKDPLLLVNEAVQEADSSDCSPTSTSIPSEPKTELNGSSASTVNPHLDQGRLSIIGFSKGCVVLNQFIYEFHYLKTLTPDDESLKSFLSCIEDMYWLDGGHNGGKNTWLTSRSLLETLTRLEVRIHVHMTPYQLCHHRRPWIHKEEQVFSDSLSRFGASIRRYVHFEDQPPSLALHLQLVAQFMSPTQPSTIPDDDEDEEDQDFERQGDSALSMMATFQDDQDDDDEELMYS